MDILSALNLGETVGLVTTLSQPNLTALSGETADFLAGGEYPIPISQGLGATSIEYKRYGVSLSYSPIAGLLSNNSQSTIEKTPGAGDLPILGALFRSNNYQKGETELVIIVTPYLVNPVNGNDIKLPTDGFEAPNIAQQILGNQNSAGKSGTSRPMPSAGEPKFAGPEVGVSDSARKGPAQADQGNAQNNTPAGTGSPRSSAADSPAPGFNLK